MIHSRSRIHWFNVLVIRRALVGGLLAGLPLVASLPAFAQEYATEQGDLALDTTVSITIEISGDGFVGDSVVYVTAVAGDDEIELGTLPTDDQGRFFGSITLPDDLEPRTYLITATGVTAVGATRVLTAEIGVGVEVSLVPAEDTPESTTSTAASVTTQERGSGLDPIETTETTSTTAAAPATEQDDPFVLIATALGFSLVGAGAAWWWSYRKQS